MRAPRAVAITGLLVAACGSSGKKGGGAVDASIAGGDQADAYVRPAAWPIPDAPPSACSPAVGCGDAGTCWQHVGGNYVCGSFALRPASTTPGQVCDGGATAGTALGQSQCCLSHADCTRGPRGRCVDNGYRWGGGTQPPPGNHCEYDWCRDDSDCAPGSSCFPAEWSGDDAPHCVRTPCRTSVDCNQGPGGACVSYYERESCSGQVDVIVYCQYSNDACRSGLDCPADAGQFGGCVPDDDGHGTRCGPGRPIARPCPP